MKKKIKNSNGNTLSKLKEKTEREKQKMEGKSKGEAVWLLQRIIKHALISMGMMMKDIVHHDYIHIIILKRD